MAGGAATAQAATPAAKAADPSAYPLELQDVSKAFGGRVILDRLWMKVPRGKTYVIIGGSGTGKSVTLKHIVGLLQPDAGRVYVLGTDMAAADRRGKDAVLLRLGFLFQGAALLGSLSVADNVALPLREHEALTSGEVGARVQEVLKMVGLDGHGAKLPAEISGGMRKRAGLARAIVRRPEILLYDEPTSGLDPVMSSVIDELTIKMRETLGVSSIVVTHDMNSAYRIADRIGMLYKGRIVEEGAPDQIRSSADPIVRAFVRGEPLPDA